MTLFQDYCNDLIKQGFTGVGVIGDDGNMVSSSSFEIEPQEIEDIKYILINERPDHNKGTLTVDHVTYNNIERTFDNIYVATAAETGCVIAKTIKSIIVATYTNHISEMDACKHIKLFSKYVATNGY